MSHSEVVKQLNELASTKEISKKAFKKYPGIIDFFAKNIRDEESIPNIVSVADDRDLMFQYFLWNLLTILCAFLMKRRDIKKSKNMADSIGRWFKRVLIIYSARLVIAYLFFGDEFSRFFSLI